MALGRIRKSKMAHSWYSDFSTDARAAEVFSGEFLHLWGGADALPAHQSIRYGGSDLSGSKVVSVPHYGDGAYDLMTAVAEGTDATPAVIATGKSQVTIARYVLARDVGDLAKMTDPSGILNPALIAQSIYSSYTRTLLDLVANVTDGFTATVTASTVMTLDDFADAISKLDIANAPAGYLAILHPKQWGELRKEIAGTAGGSIVFDPATPALVAAKGPGFQGFVLGVAVFTSTSVPSSGGDRKGCIIASDAIVWADGVPSVPATGGLIVGGKLLFEEQRKALAGTSLLVGSAYLGVSMGIDARGVTLNSDA